jgi:hypothetical protein
MRDRLARRLTALLAKERDAGIDPAGSDADRAILRGLLGR